MAEVSVSASGIDISKLKVSDLKKELKSRGLNTSGNKNELVERLQAALKSTERASNESVDDLDEDLLNEDLDDVHLETTESVISDIDTALNDSISTNKGQKRKTDDGDIKNEDAKNAQPPKRVVLNRNTPLIEQRISTESKEESEKSEKTNGTEEQKKVIKLSGLTAKERLEMRARKFDVALSNEAKKIARAERFGATPSKTSSAIQSNVKTSIEVLKQRAERFGGSVSKVMTNMDHKERLEKRKARFGIVTAADKAKQRLERFKQPVK